MSRVLAKFVQKLLNVNQKSLRVSVSEELWNEERITIGDKIGLPMVMRSKPKNNHLNESDKRS